MTLTIGGALTFSGTAATMQCNVLRRTRQPHPRSVFQELYLLADIC